MQIDTREKRSAHAQTFCTRAMQISLWRQPRNRPMPLTSSVVEQVMARFLTFTAYKKVKI